MQIKRNVILSLVDKPIFAAVHICIVMNSYRLGSQEHEAFISAVDVSLVYDIKIVHVNIFIISELLNYITSPTPISMVVCDIH